jgi:hypothetical protein
MVRRGGQYARHERALRELQIELVKVQRHVIIRDVLSCLDCPKNRQASGGIGLQNHLSV